MDSAIPGRSRQDAVINPVRGRNAPNLGPFALLISPLPDLTAACAALKLAPQSQRLYNSRLFQGADREDGVAAAGPVLGSPLAAMILENLVAWGARRILFIGWCGALSESVQIGDVLVPTGAFIEEGTSAHYDPDHGGRAHASPWMTERIRAALARTGVPFLEGPVWTTDAVFRETPQKVVGFRDKGALAVEMEFSALCTVARFRGVELGGLLVVSDELSSLTWRRGFSDKRFTESRKRLIDVIRSLCPEMTKPMP